MANRRGRTRRRTRRRTSLRFPSISGRAVREFTAIALVLAAIVSAIGIFAPDAGFLIRPWHDALTYLLGWGVVVAPLLLVAVALMLWVRPIPVERWLSVVGAALFAVCVLGMLHLASGVGAAWSVHREGGGWLGFLASGAVTAAMGPVGAWAVLVVGVLIGFGLYFNISLGDLIPDSIERRADRASREPGRGVRDPREATAIARAPARDDTLVARAGVEPPRDGGAGRPVRSRILAGLLGRRATEAASDHEPVILRRQRPGDGRAAVGPGTPALAAGAAPAGASAALARAAAGRPAAAGGVSPDGTAAIDTDGEADATPPDPPASDAASVVLAARPRTWELPSLDLLADAGPSAVAQLDLATRGQLIRETLANFRIGVKVARIQEGPVVTQYALEVEPGIKLSRIEALADNLALALSARSIRIEAPIPGQPYVGIEIPNSAFDLVTLKEVLTSKTFEEASARSKLAFALGQDVAGQPHAADLTRMPHLLIAGATGSGKSVCVNALICSLLARATPEEVKLILIDPKRVEMAQYRGIPHLLCEVIVDPEKAVNALKWTVATMESRYHEFAQRGVRNIGGYNAALRAGEPEMPYIVVVIDELADLMMVSAYEVESTVTRVAQLARATGIHLVVATQRPSVQVITGLIKANIPSRIAFAMTSGIDSRTILDATGAEDLLGRGDMLYQPIDAPRAVRLQGVLVTDGEIDQLARHWREQGGPEYRPEITASKPADRGAGVLDDAEDAADPLLRQAVDIVRRSDKASASLLQRRLRIGYARAARILDQMEDRGIVGAADGSKFREVLVTPDGWGGELTPGERER